jgi:hypothetical protein
MTNLNALSNIALSIEEALAVEDFPRAQSLIDVYSQSLDTLIRGSSTTSYSVVKDALALFSKCLLQVRAARSHQLQELSLVRAGARYSESGPYHSSVNIAG